MKTFFLLILLFIQNLSAQETLTVVAVGEAEVEKDKISFEQPDFEGLKASEASAIKELVKIWQSDFDFYRELFEVDKSIDKKNEKSRFHVNSKIVIESDIAFLDYKLIDQEQKKDVLSGKKQINFAKIRKFAHEISHDMYRAITGKESIFKSKILFVSDRDSRNGDTIKEIYIMDFDGGNKEKITSLRSMIISPSLSPDNSKILFTLVEDQIVKSSNGKGTQRVKNLNLYLMDLKTKQRKLVSSVAGINSGAVFSKDGKSIYLTLSYQKNADIFKMDLKTLSRTRITNHYRDDVDPHINADESLMTFLSGRPGKAMIYTLDPSGVEKSVKRISFVGRFNAAPRFNPEGTEIVFSSWVDDRFDIYRIGSNGTNLVRLTKNFGSNEEPWFSPDGQFIVFTSQRVITRRRAVQDVYIMNREGEIIRKITENYGKIFTPRWSN